MNLTRVDAPRGITGDDDLSSFDSGEPVLDDWLRKRALANDASGASRTYVVTSGARVVGYYSLATGSVEAAKATGKARRNMPDPIPVIIIGRLAVDRAVQGQGLGSALLRDALVRIVAAAEVVGARAVLLHAISEEAKRFYRHHGFVESPVDPMTLMITIADVKRALP